MTVQRMAMVIGARAEKLALYKEVHAQPWPEMNTALSAANIVNYSIYLREPENLLFGYWEYAGTNYAEDMKVLGERGITGPSERLPYLQTIQRSFGKHDVSAIQAHADGAAREGAEVVKARHEGETAGAR